MEPMTTETEKNPTEGSRQTQEQEAPLTFWQVLGSTLAAAFGVQSSKNRKRDFTRGSAGQFILMGIGFTVVFVLIMIGVVRLVLSLST